MVSARGAKLCALRVGGERDTRRLVLSRSNILDVLASLLLRRWPARVEARSRGQARERV